METLRHRRLATLLLVLLAWSVSGCARLQLPSIDPTGNRLFIPGQSTQLLGTNAASQSGSGILGANPLGWNRASNSILPALGSQQQFPTSPAFQRPPVVQDCNVPPVAQTGTQRCLIPQPILPKRRGRQGEIIMTPKRIVAPVGAEVVVLAGICGGDGYFVTNQPLEWMLSNDSVGQLIEVGGTDKHKLNNLIPPSARKIDGDYAWGRTSLNPLKIDRGTPTPTDDIHLLKGQSFVSVSSASPGTSYITGVAPKAEAWDKRRASTIIHWVDALWAIPTPSQATAGTVHPLTTVVSRSSNGSGVEGYKVKYTIVGGAPAEFAPTGSKEAIVDTGADGRATAQIRQVAGQFDPGTTQVRVDVIQPAMFGQQELVVESGITSVNWSSPALTIRAIGPRSAGVDEPFNYRIEVSNPGDQLARDVVVRTDDIGSDLDYISSTPKPTQYGRSYEWRLGDIAPGAPPKLINLQLKSDKRGTADLCFDVESQTDQLRTEACAQTEIEAPCIGMEIDGPTTGTIGSQAQFNLNIVNQCEESLQNIVFQVQYDPTLVAVDENGNSIGNPTRLTIPSLPFGQSKQIPLTFTPTETGSKCFDLTVTAENGHSARARRCLEVSGQGAGNGGQADGTGPSNGMIDFDIEGQQVTSVGGQARVRGVIKNNGNQPINNVILTNKFSPSLEPVSVTDNYSHNWLGDALAFNVGQIAPGETAYVDVLFQGVQPDGNAFSEMTVTTTSGIGETRRLPIRIEQAVGGTNTNPDGQPGLQNPNGQDPDILSPGSQSGDGMTDPNPFPDEGQMQPREPEGPIVIPQDPNTNQNASQPGLQAFAKTINRNIYVSDGQDRGANAAIESAIEFTIRNNSSAFDQNVDLKLLVPQSLRLTNFDPMESDLSLVSRSEDFTQFSLQRIFDMRPGEELTFRAIVSGVQPGQATVEVSGVSDNSVGTVTASDVVNVVQ